MLHIIARIIETIATRNATRASKAHAQRKAQRYAREALAPMGRAVNDKRERAPYPFHV